MWFPLVGKQLEEFPSVGFKKGTEVMPVTAVIVKTVYIFLATILTLIGKVLTWSAVVFQISAYWLCVIALRVER